MADLNDKIPKQANAIGISESALEKQDNHTTLAQYSSNISKLHTQSQNHAESAIECELKVGALLIEAKGSVKHGQWLPSLNCSCDG